METIILLIIIGAIVSFFSSKSSTQREKVSYINPEGRNVTEKLARRRPREAIQLEEPEMEITPEIEEVLFAMASTKQNIFLTGKAGAGKSTLIQYFRATTTKNHAVIAPTGIAAINVQGQTIHSFFGFYIDITPHTVKLAKPNKRLVIRNIETLIIDEISMVRADMLDCIDKALRLNRSSDEPFGGVQIIAVGDPYQLPPVVTTSELKLFNGHYTSPHFFSAHSYKSANFKTYELTKVYRQSDNTFKGLLNRIRSGEVKQNDIDGLNRHVSQNMPDKFSINLVTTNALVKSINKTELEKLPGESVLYKGQLIDNFDEKSVPTDIELELKPGAKVMLLNNDKTGKWVNGDIGQVSLLGVNSVRVVFEDNTYDDIGLNVWEKVEFVYDDELGRVAPVVTGKFIQLPIKLAWAMTIHKSQGKSYEKVHINFGNGTFTDGQAYVAFSRCRSLNGLSIEQTINLSDIKTDPMVQQFMLGTSTKKREVSASPSSMPTKNTNSPLTKSELNRFNSFLENPAAYATGSGKAIQKIEAVQDFYRKMKSGLSEEQRQKYLYALKKYNDTLRTRG